MKFTNKQLATLFVEQTESANASQLASAADTLVAFLAERGELNKLKDVLRSIDGVWKETYGIATLTIETAHPLSAATRTSLQKKLNGAELRERVDASLIGGARIRIDDRIIDGSVSGALVQLTKHLSA